MTEAGYPDALAGRGSDRMTHHARARLRQRGIGLDVLDCLLRYGREQHDHRGATIVVFDRKALEAMRRVEAPGVAQAAQNSRRIYAVVGSDGQVLTAGHRVKRVIRDHGLSNVRPRRPYA